MITQVGHAVGDVWVLLWGSATTLTVLRVEVRVVPLQVSLARLPAPAGSKILPVPMTLRLEGLAEIETVSVRLGHAAGGAAGVAVTVSFEVSVMGADGLVPLGANAPKAEDLDLAHGFG